MYLSRQGQSQIILPKCILAKWFLGPSCSGSPLLKATGSISFWFLEYLVSWDLCKQNLWFYISSLASKRSFFLLFPDTPQKIGGPGSLPFDLHFSLKFGFSGKFHCNLLWMDECRLVNYIESTEINFYNPNRVSSWVPVRVRWLWTQSSGYRGPSGRLTDSDQSSLMSHFLCTGE